LVANAGGNVSFVEGEPANRKITTREDLLVAEALLADRQAPATAGTRVGADGADQLVRDEANDDGSG
jgi:hypothetical protein